eukprot:SAG11_NODE_562_length_8523_cov_38.875356_6_plen_65_part_00
MIDFDDDVCTATGASKMMQFNRDNSSTTGDVRPFIDVFTSIFATEIVLFNGEYGVYGARTQHSP